MLATVYRINMKGQNQESRVHLGSYYNLVKKMVACIEDGAMKVQK